MYGSGGTLRDLSVTGFTSEGLRVGNNWLIENCQVYKNGGSRAIWAANGCTIRDCTVREHTWVGFAVGIQAGDGSSIIGCTVTESKSTSATPDAESGMGILISSGCLVKDCDVYRNMGTGLKVNGHRNLIVGNNLAQNGFGTGADGAGIWIEFGVGNRIDGNHVTTHDRGIEVESQSNIIIRNTVYGNTVEFEIANGNRVGVISTAPSSGAISGATGGGGVGTTDPWANITW